MWLNMMLNTCRFEKHREEIDNAEIRDLAEFQKDNVEWLF